MTVSWRERVTQVAPQAVEHLEVLQQLGVSEAELGAIVTTIESGGEFEKTIANTYLRLFADPEQRKRFANVNLGASPLNVQFGDPKLTMTTEVVSSMAAAHALLTSCLKTVERLEDSDKVRELMATFDAVQSIIGASNPLYEVLRSARLQLSNWSYDSSKADVLVSAARDVALFQSGGLALVVQQGIRSAERADDDNVRFRDLSTTLRSIRALAAEGDTIREIIDDSFERARTCTYDSSKNDVHLQTLRDIDAAMAGGPAAVLAEALLQLEGTHDDDVRLRQLRSAVDDLEHLIPPGNPMREILAEAKRDARHWTYAASKGDVLSAAMRSIMAFVEGGTRNVLEQAMARRPLDDRAYVRELTTAVKSAVTFLGPASPAGQILQGGLTAARNASVDSSKVDRLETAIRATLTVMDHSTRETVEIF